MKNDKKKVETKLPIYHQISEYLIREITSGRWLPGDRLPVEAALSANLGVAVGTLRKSLAQLEEKGFIERRQGSGTYVKRVPEGKAIYEFFHLERISGGGALTANTIALDQSDEPKITEILGSKVAWRLRRQRQINRELVAIEEIFFSVSHAPKLDKTALHESLYLHYEKNFGFWISKVEDRIDSAAAPDWVCEALGLSLNTVLPRVERRGWSNENKIEEISHTWFDPAKARYVARWR